ncbi:MAG: tetratricopeptide repeat protein [Deltaproteobacteria bacterium]|nr:tetratricopeptide repeat protein [Deltaproteobacteria bacterium]
MEGLKGTEEMENAEGAKIMEGLRREAVRAARGGPGPDPVGPGSARRPPEPLEGGERDAGEREDGPGALRRRLRETCARRGPEHPETLEAELRLGIALLEGDDPEGAEEHLMRCLEGRRKVLGPGSAEARLAQRFLALAALGLGRPGEAAGLWREASAETRKLPGEDMIQVLRCRLRVAEGSRSRDWEKEGFPALSKAAARLQELLGADALAAAEAKCRAAESCLSGPRDGRPGGAKAGTGDEAPFARALLEDVLAGGRKLLDSRPDLALRLYSLLREAALRSADDAGLLAALEGAAGYSEMSRGLLAPETLDLRHEFAGRLFAAGRLEEARLAQEQLLEARAAAQGGEAVDTLLAKAALGKTLAVMGDKAKALELLDAAAEGLARAGAPAFQEGRSAKKAAEDLRSGRSLAFRGP